MALVVQPSATNAQSSGQTLKVAIPAYIFSDDLRGWEAIIDQAGSTPVAVINPRNGPNVYSGTRCDNYTPPVDPGTGPNLSGLRSDDDFVSPRFPNDPKLVTTQTNYLSTLEQHFVRRSSALGGSGIGVYGYVWSNTNGANASCPRSASLISDEIDKYKQVYGISNIFFDDAASTCPNDARKAMTDLARSKGAKIILNPGTISDSCLATEAEVVVNFEGTPSSYLSARDSLIANEKVLHQANPTVKLWHIIYGATSADVDPIVAQAQLTADYLYITDDTTSAHGCDRGNSNLDALFGTWPIIRQDIAACTSRSNGGRTWASVVDAIRVAPILHSIPTTTVPVTTIPPTTAAPTSVLVTTSPTPAPTTPATVAPITTTAPTATTSKPLTTAASGPVVIGTPLTATSTSTTTTTLAVAATPAVLSPTTSRLTATTPTTTPSTTKLVTAATTVRATSTTTTVTKKATKTIVTKKNIPKKSVAKKVVARKVTPRKSAKKK
jgi:Spherulation-specific family 4